MGSLVRPNFFFFSLCSSVSRRKKLGDLDKTAAMQEYVESILKKAAEMPPSADLTRFVEAVTPVRANVQRKAAASTHPVASASKPPPAAAEGTAANEGSSGVADKAEMIAHQVDRLREAVLQDSLKVARLQQSLEGGSNEVQMTKSGICSCSHFVVRGDRLWRSIQSCLRRWSVV